MTPFTIFAEVSNIFPPDWRYEAKPSDPTKNKNEKVGLTGDFFKEWNKITPEIHIRK